MDQAETRRPATRQSNRRRRLVIRIAVSWQLRERGDATDGRLAPVPVPVEVTGLDPRVSVAVEHRRRAVREHGRRHRGVDEA
jgi:hypothetical protein